MNITGIMQLINSKRDIYGNVYWAIEYTDIKTGKTVKGTIDTNNHRGAIDFLGGDIKVIETEMKILEFKRYIKDLPNWGSNGEHIAKYINDALKDNS